MEVFERRSGDVPGGLFGWTGCSFPSVGLYIAERHFPKKNHSVESSGCNGASFTNSYPDWRQGTYENFKDWAVKQFGLNGSDEDDDDNVPVNFMKAKDIEFEENRRGELIVPPLMNFRTVREKQRVVRGYIGAIYRAYINVLLPFFFHSLNGKENSLKTKPRVFLIFSQRKLINKSIRKNVFQMGSF